MSNFKGSAFGEFTRTNRSDSAPVLDNKENVTPGLPLVETKGDTASRANKPQDTVTLVPRQLSRRVILDYYQCIQVFLNTFDAAGKKSLSIFLCEIKKSHSETYPLALELLNCDDESSQTLGMYILYGMRWAMSREEVAQVFNHPKTTKLYIDNHKSACDFRIEVQCELNDSF